MEIERFSQGESRAGSALLSPNMSDTSQAIVQRRSLLYSDSDSSIHGQEEFDGVDEGEGVDVLEKFE